jgi:hypothetical protein
MRSGNKEKVRECWGLALSGTMLSTALQNLVAAFPMLRQAVAESGVVSAPVMRARVMLGVHYETRLRLARMLLKPLYILKSITRLLAVKIACDNCFNSKCQCPSNCRRPGVPGVRARRPAWCRPAS